MKAEARAKKRNAKQKIQRFQRSGIHKKHDEELKRVESKVVQCAMKIQNGAPEKPQENITPRVFFLILGENESNIFFLTSPCYYNLKSL